MEKKISLPTFILALILTLILGIGAGYLLSTKINKEQVQNEKSMVNTPQNITTNNITNNNDSNIESIDSNIENNNFINTTSDNTSPQTDYEYNKEIIINGQKNTISLNANSTTKDNYEVYFNNKLIKSISIGSSEYYQLDKINVNKFCDDHIVIEILTNGPTNTLATVLLVNTQGTILVDLNKNDAYGRSIKSTGELASWYTIDDDSIITFEESRNFLTKVKYTINNSQLVKESIALNKWNDVEESGKY